MIATCYCQFMIAICNEVNFPPTCYAHHVRLTTVRERAQHPISIINNIELHAFINFITKSRYGSGGTKTETNKKMRLI